MTITHTWKITSVKTKTEGTYANTIVQVYWNKIGTDENGKVGVFSGVTPFSTTTMSDGDIFIPYIKLTEETVLKWVKDIVVADYEQVVNTQIARNIADNVVPVIELSIPWDTTIEIARTT